MEFDLKDFEHSLEKAIDAVVLVKAMIAWFQTHYEDPAESTPYDSAEGGYQYLGGGPCHAREELETYFEHELKAQFEDDELEEIINAAVDKIEEGGMFDWAKVLGPDDFDIPTPLLRAFPHQWGKGHVHYFDAERDRTLCGRTRATCPGD
jgi:hypothetical protein